MKLSYRNQKNAEAISRILNKPLDKPDWFKVQAKDNGDSEILIYDFIGWPFNDPRELIAALSGMGSVTVRINSPGGDVFDGMAIYNAFQSHKGTVTTRIEGVAASMASVIAMAGKKVQAYDNTMLMIHNAWTVMAGNQYDLRETADILEKIDGNILNVYYDKSKTGKRELSDMMKAETWLTAKEAKEKGFVDLIVDGKAAKAQFDLSMFANAPDDIAAAKAGRELTEREIERALRDAGASRNFAKAVAAGRSGGGQGGTQRDVEGVKDALKNVINIFR
jgi:ATP-dependent Clp endopeptidase proteolytic subunit ClpP